MAWFFKGTGQQLGLSLSPQGCWSAYGTCSQSCHPMAGDLDVLKYVHGAEGSWSIHSPDAQAREYDGLGDGLKTVFDKNEGKAAAAIRYYDKGTQHPALVSAQILMPQPAFNDLLALFRRIIGNANISYVITLEFMGFTSPEVQAPEHSSLADFVNPNLLDARPYFSDEVEVSVRAFS